MEVVGWSPSEELQDSEMFQLPPPVKDWTGTEDGASSLYAGPSSFPFPKSPSPYFESATVYQRRLKDPGHVPRPRNAFIIFRCHFTEKYVASGGSERASDMEKKSKSLSKRAGEAWKNETAETKRYYKRLADEERSRHRIEHPNYRFRPKRQKSAGQTGRRQSSKSKADNRCSKRSASRSPFISSVERNEVSRNNPLQIQTITIPTTAPSTLSQPYLSRQPTPDFVYGYGSTTPTSPCSPLSPVDDILYMPRPTIAVDPSDPLLSCSMDDSQIYGYPKDSLAPFPDDFLFGRAYAALDSTPSYGYPPLAAVASSLAGWNGNGQGKKEDLLTPKPVFRHELDFTDTFTSFALSDVNMGYLNVPLGSDPMSIHSDMDAYRMGLMEYGITPASNQ